MGEQKLQKLRPNEHAGSTHGPLKVNQVAEAENDTEGNTVRVRPFAEPDEGIRVHPVAGDDDTEGHRRNFH
jgi:hypothetical protein